MKFFVCRFFAVVVSVMGASLFLSSDALAFRCGGSVVEIGDTKSRVLIECGKPTYKDRVGTKDVTTIDEGKKSRKKKSRSVEQWTYNCGEGDFIYILTFDGGKLKKEETSGRGKGKSQCKGK